MSCPRFALETGCRVDAAAEDRQASAFLGQLLPARLAAEVLRVLERLEKGVGVGHEAEYPAGGVTQSRDSRVRSIDIVAVGEGPEAVGHVLWEMTRWLDLHVKDAKPRGMAASVGQ